MTGLDDERIKKNLLAFYAYQASYNQELVKWAKKAGKKHENIGIKELLRYIGNKQNENFLLNMSPTAFKNLPTILRAILSNGEDKNEFFKRYVMVSEEFRTKDKKVNNVNIDRDFRISLSRHVSINKEGIPELTLPSPYSTNKDDTDDCNLFYHMSELVESRRTYKNMWDDEGEPRDMFKSSAIYSLIQRDKLEEVIEQCKNTDILFAIDEMMAWKGVIFTDFWKVKTSSKEMRRLAKLANNVHAYTYPGYDRILAKMEEAEENDHDSAEYFKLHNEIKELAEEALKDLTQLYMYLALIYQVVLMYSSARDIANKAIIENSELQQKLAEEKARNLKQEVREKQKANIEKDAIEAERKQEVLNSLQLKYDKLRLEHEKALQENAFLVNLLKHEDEEEPAEEETEEIPEEKYPKGTVLFGGHPIWRKHFAAKHPQVKIIDGTKNFPENVVSSRTPLVLLNSRHMAHKIYYRIRNVIQRAGVEVRYIG